MTITEAARVLALSPKTVQRQVLKGRIRATRHGSQWWITEAAIAEYREKSLGKPGRRAPAPPAGER